MAAVLAGTRVGVRDTELALPFFARLGQLGVQAVAVGLPILLLGAYIKDPEGAVWTQFIGGGIALVFWSTVSAATRFARGPAVLVGPAFAAAVLAIPLVEQRYGARLGWESAITSRWTWLTLGSLVVALWPRRISPRRTLSRPALTLLLFVVLADSARGWLTAPRWSPDTWGQRRDTWSRRRDRGLP